MLGLELTEGFVLEAEGTTGADDTDPTKAGQDQRELVTYSSQAKTHRGRRSPPPARPEQRQRRTCRKESVIEER